MYVHQNHATNINKLYHTAHVTTPTTGVIPNSRAHISPMYIGNVAITWTTPLVIMGSAKINVELTILQHNNLKSS